MSYAPFDPDSRTALVIDLHPGLAGPSRTDWPKPGSDVIAGPRVMNKSELPRRRSKSAGAVNRANPIEHRSVRLQRDVYRVARTEIPDFEVVGQSLNKTGPPQFSLTSNSRLQR